MLKKELASVVVGNRLFVKNIMNNMLISVDTVAREIIELALNGKNKLDIIETISQEYENSEEVSEELEKLFDQIMFSEIFTNNSSLNKTNIDNLLSIPTDNKLIDILVEDAIKVNQIILVDIELTYLCCFKCKHCYQPEAWKENISTVSGVNWIKILHEMKSLGVFYLTFTGGEFLMHPDFISIVKEARKLLFDVTIFTNGYLLSEEYIQIFSEIGISECVVSVYGSSEESYEKNCGICGQERIFKTLKELKYNNINTSVRIIEDLCDIDEQEKIIKYLKEFKIPFEITDNLFFFKDIQKDENEIEFITSNSATHQNKLCSAGLLKIRIDAKGDVFPCELVRSSLGNIFVTSFKEILNSNKRKNILKYVEKYRDISVSNNSACPANKILNALSKGIEDDKK